MLNITIKNGWGLKMSLQKYKALLCAVETGSISAAAVQLGYTQSAVSRMIADLEQEWGIMLLHRSRSGIEVTAEGKLLLPIVRAVAAGCSELDLAIQELHGIQTGLVRVGTFTTVAECWIPGLLKSFGTLYPNISFDLINSDSYMEIEDWIRHGKVDCGFVRMDAAADLDARFLQRDCLTAVLPVNHPLASEPVFPVEQMKRESLIKLKIDREISRFLDGVPVRYEVSSDHTILSMVESGIGVSIMHSLIAESPRYQILWKPLDRTEYRDIGIATAKNIRLSAAAGLFVEHVCRQIKRGCKKTPRKEKSLRP